MILVGQYDSPFVRRVALVLHHQGHQFERKVLSTFNDFEEMLRINPLGKVPALILPDGETLFDSRAIIEYLDLLAPPEKRLLPEQDPFRRDVLRIEIVGISLTEKIYERGIEFTRRAPGTSDPNWCERLERQILSACGWLESRCDDGWFVTERMTRADLAVAVGMQHLERVLPSLDSIKRFPVLYRHRQRCEALPIFRRVQDSREEALKSGWRPEESSVTR